jgi:hypothetical protein
MNQSALTAKRPITNQLHSHTDASSLPDKLSISIKVDGLFVEVGKRYRDRDGCLCVAWSVPPSRIEDEIFFLHS